MARGLVLLYMHIARIINADKYNMKFPMESCEERSNKTNTVEYYYRCQL